MKRILALIAMVLFPALLCAVEPGELTKVPITMDNTPVGKLLKKWYAEGSACGNVGDWYDNRDGEHSPLDVRQWPQLQKVKYSDEDFKLRKNWAAQRLVLPHVTFGNSSTSAPPLGGGSNPRMYYTSPFGLQLLEQHYRKNNLYIYPEHRDHDPGRNGVGPGTEEGWGDLYPTNTPYLLISQGSSGSDQPFMRAIPFTLAAFRPEVKKLIVDKGYLMPTLQRILRETNKSLKAPEDYFTGKAHPSVFEGGNVDPLAMINKAHDMTRDTIPPLACVRVIEEDNPRNMQDFFDLPGRTEKLVDTAHVVARIWRGTSLRRRVILSARDSEDINGKGLKYRWLVLRGDEKKITIRPRGDHDVEAEILLEHHPRRPVWPGAPIDSNRIDIGLFADNGKSVSTPAFFTFLMLDDEERSPGKIVYGASTTDAKVADWGKLLGILATAEGVEPKVRKSLELLLKKYTITTALRAEAQKPRQEAEKKRNEASARRVLAEKKAKADPKDATAAREWEETKKEQSAVDLTFKAADDRFKQIEKTLTTLLDTPEEALGGTPRAYGQARLKPTMPREAVTYTTRVNYVDPRLVAPKRWTDEYGKDGDWVRREDGKSSRFTREGWLVTEEDDKKRPIRAVAVNYRQGPPPGRTPFNTTPLRWEKGAARFVISYDGDKRSTKPDTD